MKITKAYALQGTTILLTLIFLVSQILKFNDLANTARSLILPFVCILYLLKVKDRSFYFSGFLIIFSLVEFMKLWLFAIEHSYMFFIGNSLYIVAYIFLILELLKQIKNSNNYKSFFTKYAIYIAVIVLLDVYLIVLLGDMVRLELNYHKYVLVMAFNSVILIVLSVALLSFFCSYTKKALVTFLASLCLVFSEIVQIAHYYLPEVNSLNIIYSLLLVMAFYLFIKQAFIIYTHDNAIVKPV